MIEIRIVNRFDDTDSVIEVNGHSKIGELCNAISILLKYLELGLVELTNDCRINKPKEGQFDIAFSASAETMLLTNTFKKTIEWLIKKYPAEINFKEV